MSDVYRANRKATDADILRLNTVGLSLATIARALGCHPTTITLRLKSLKVAPADTRRAFMEDVFLSLSEPEQEWFADTIQTVHSLREFITKLITDEYQRTHP
jgi:AcrR family transcriptional regulator